MYCKESAAKCGLVRKTVTAVAESSYHWGCDKAHNFLFVFLHISIYGEGRKGALCLLW